ncbi:hypothetical protein [Methanocella paludicola]|uniref:hypothetical protein n=1 Tax=Methanocella paludicola TaxID=570267 RepID=UPI0010083BC2|nr:hypothetical protein [Methanocella paludicola]
MNTHKTDLQSSPDVLDYRATAWWKIGLNRQEGIIGIILRGKGFQELQQKCSGCQKNVYVAFQLVV